MNVRGVEISFEYPPGLKCSSFERMALVGSQLSTELHARPLLGQQGARVRSKDLGLPNLTASVVIDMGCTSVELLRRAVQVTRLLGRLGANQIIVTRTMNCLRSPPPRRWCASEKDKSRVCPQSGVVERSKVITVSAGQEALRTCISRLAQLGTAVRVVSTGSSVLGSLLL